MGRKTVKLKTGKTLPTACTVISSLVPVASLSFKDANVLNHANELRKVRNDETNSITPIQNYDGIQDFAPPAAAAADRPVGHVRIGPPFTKSSLASIKST